eukprot:g11779.t1
MAHFKALNGSFQGAQWLISTKIKFWHPFGNKNDVEISYRWNMNLPAKLSSLVRSSCENFVETSWSRARASRYAKVMRLPKPNIFRLILHPRYSSVIEQFKAKICAFIVWVSFLAVALGLALMGNVWSKETRFFCIACAIAFFILIVCYRLGWGSATVLGLVMLILFYVINILITIMIVPGQFYLAFMYLVVSFPIAGFYAAVIMYVLFVAQFSIVCWYWGFSEDDRGYDFLQCMRSFVWLSFFFFLLVFYHRLVLRAISILKKQLGQEEIRRKKNGSEAPDSPSSTQCSGPLNADAVLNNYPQPRVAANGGNGANGLCSLRTRAANGKQAGRSNHEYTPPSPMPTTGPKAPPNSVRSTDVVCEIAPGPYELSKATSIQHSPQALYSSVTSVTANQNLVVPCKLNSRQSSARSASESSCDMLLVVPCKLNSRQSSARSASESSCDMLLVSDALPLAWVNHQDEDLCAESNPVGTFSVIYNKSSNDKSNNSSSNDNKSSSVSISSSNMNMNKNENKSRSRSSSSLKGNNNNSSNRNSWSNNCNSCTNGICTCKSSSERLAVESFDLEFYIT